MTSLLLGHRPPDLAKPFTLCRPGLRQRLHHPGRRRHVPACGCLGVRLQSGARRVRQRPRRPRRPEQCAVRGDLVRRPGSHARRDAAGLRLHGVARRAELDLAGQPSASGRRGGEAAQAGRAGLPELQRHHRLDRDGAGAGADADAGGGEPGADRCRGARRAGFHRSAEAGGRAVLPGQPGDREPAGRHPQAGPALHRA